MDDGMDHAESALAFGRPAADPEQDGDPARPVLQPRPQRARGEARAEFALSDERTRLVRLHQSGCLKLRFPRPSGGRAQAILINTAGGLTGGDRLGQAFTVRDAGSLSVTTQGCERVYRAASGIAEVATRVIVGQDASFAWLPQETILFDAGALRRDLEIDCAASSRLLLCESVVLGREHMNESVRSGLLRDRWRVRRDGRLVFADDLQLAGRIDRLAAGPAALAGNRALATILLQAAGAEALAGHVRELLGKSGGASAFEGLLVARLVAPSGFLLRKRLVPVLSVLAGSPLPLVWSL